MPGEGDVEGRLVPQRRRVHPPADEEAGAAAEQNPHHQQHPEGQKIKNVINDAAILIQPDPRD